MSDNSLQIDVSETPAPGVFKITFQFHGDEPAEGEFDLAPLGIQTEEQAIQWVVSYIENELPNYLTQWLDEDPNG